ncbi:MAG: formylmethanofuran dehydrogenase [Methylibium sp. NZG]|nr:MAG: formylmethanofuran dehydrogenase [Methylibium sp. NZG]
MSTRLRLRTAPALRVDLRGVTPGVQLAQGMVTHGNQTLALADLFDITQRDGPADELVFEGDLARFDRVGWQMTFGSIVVDGNVGDYVGGAMTGGTITVRGHARDLAACEMAGGSLIVEGNVGDFCASTLPGSMDGMRGGTFIVKGDAGERFADRMRRGSALVFGNVGDFVASRMVAGTVVVGGAAGAHAGYGMRRGSVVLAGAAPEIAPTFVPALADAAVFWQLLARDLARHGGPFAELPSRRITRHLGDLGAGGQGELILVA